MITNANASAGRQSLNVTKQPLKLNLILKSAIDFFRVGKFAVKSIPFKNLFIASKSNSEKPTPRRIHLDETIVCFNCKQKNCAIAEGVRLRFCTNFHNFSCVLAAKRCSSPFSHCPREKIPHVTILNVNQMFGLRSAV